jgi:hypothetical protein
VVFAMGEAAGRPAVGLVPGCGHVTSPKIGAMLITWPSAAMLSFVTLRSIWATQP